MNAQQQLAHLLGNDTERDKSPARRFLRDHGPAIAELIEAARKSLPHLPVDETCCGFPVGGYMDNNHCEPPSCCGNPVYPHQELKAALAKLTEPK